MSKDKYLGNHTLQTSGSFNIVSEESFVGINTEDPQKDLVLAGDDVVFRIGTNVGTEGDNFSSRIEMAESCTGDDGVMTHGGFIEWDGDTGGATPHGRFVFGARDGSTTDADVFKIDRDSAADSICVTSIGVGILIDDPTTALQVYGTITTDHLAADTIAVSDFTVESPLKIACETDESSYALHIKKNGGSSTKLIKIENEDHSNTGSQGHWVISHLEVGNFIIGADEGDYNFLIQADTGHVGIGTTDPQSLLDIAGNAAIGSSYAGTSAGPTDGLIVEGNVGIGTESPGVLLHVVSEVSLGGHIRLDQYNDDPDGPNIQARHARDASLGSSAAVEDDDYIGSFDFCGHDGTNFEVFAAIKARVDGSDATASNHPGKIIFQTYDDNSAALDTKMTIKNDGWIGIGTTAPNAPFHVKGENGADATVLLSNDKAHDDSDNHGDDCDILQLKFSNQTSANLTSNTNNFIVFSSSAENVGAIDFAADDSQWGESGGLQTLYPTYLTQAGGTLTTGITFRSGASDVGEWFPLGDQHEWGVEDNNGINFPIEEGTVVYVRDALVRKDPPGMPMVVTRRAMVCGNSPIKIGPSDDNYLPGVTLSFIGQLPVNIMGSVNDGDYIVPSEEHIGFCRAVAPDSITFEEYIGSIGIALQSYDGELGACKVWCAIGVKSKYISGS